MHQGQRNDLVLVKGNATHHATIAGTRYDAWEHDETHMLVDLRIQGVFDPEALRLLGVPEDLIATAATCDPVPGFVLLDKDSDEA